MSVFGGAFTLKAKQPASKSYFEIFFSRKKFMEKSRASYLGNKVFFNIHMAAWFMKFLIEKKELLKAFFHELFATI